MAKKTKKTVIFFVDALKESYLPNMPNLKRFAEQNSSVRLKTVPGYSGSAHASIWSGCYPEKTGCFLNYYPNKYKNHMTREYPLAYYLKYVPNYHLRYIIKNIAFKLRNVLFNDYGLLPGANETNWKYICYDNFGTFYFYEHILKNNLFKLLKDNSIDFHYHNKNKSSFDDWKIHHLDNTINIFFSCRLDFVSQKYGINSNKFNITLAKIDRILYNFFKQLQNDNYNIIIFSDHGMMETKKVITLEDELKNINFKLGKDYFYFFDTTFARFWANNEAVRKKILYIFSKNKNIEFLDINRRRELKIDFRDNKYGDLLFLCKPGIVIATTPVQKYFKKNIKAMHGYDPSCNEMDAVCISNCFDAKDGSIVDIMPSILKLYGISIPKNIDGKAWKLK